MLFAYRVDTERAGPEFEGLDNCDWCPIFSVASKLPEISDT